MIERESGWWPWATNPNDGSSCRPWTEGGNYGSCGFGQHLSRYWAGRLDAYVWPTWFAKWPHVSPLDARANMIVTARMMAASGICPGAWCLP